MASTLEIHSYPRKNINKYLRMLLATSPFIWLDYQLTTLEKGHFEIATLTIPIICSDVVVILLSFTQ
jgi:hypothetical protein